MLKAIVIDQVVSFVMNANTTHELKITLAGTTVSVVVDGNTLIGYTFNANVVDGDFGLLALSGAVRVDEITYMTDDPVYLPETGDALTAVTGALADESSLDVLRADQLMTVVNSVLDDWLTESYIEYEQYQQLKAARFFMMDLPGDLLGLAAGDAVYIDTTAAGYGWYVDGTPLGNEGFVTNADGTLYARANSDAVGRMDLVSVVSHELGHLLSLSHEDGSAMSETLAVGERSIDLRLDDADRRTLVRMPRPLDQGFLYELLTPTWMRLLAGTDKAVIDTLAATHGSWFIDGTPLGDERNAGRWTPYNRAHLR